MFHNRIFLIVSTAVLVSPAFSQSANQSLTAQDRPTVLLTCADFQRNLNGSWSPLHQVTINGVTMGGPGVAFTEGVSFGGGDLGAALNRQCR